MPAKLFFVCVIAILFCGCRSDIKPVKGSGVPASESRRLDSFHSVAIAGIGEVTIEFGSAASCNLTMDENLLDLYETRVKSGVLYLAPTVTVTPKSGIRVKLTTNELDEIKLQDSCSVTLKHFSGPKLGLSLSGASEIEVKGTTSELELDVDGACQANLFNLECESVTIDASGAGRLKVKASKQLKVTADGTTQVIYDGNPAVSKELQGLATVESK